MSQLFSWHQSAYQSIWQQHVQARLPHALLVSGVAGVGKRQFAQVLAQALLCRTPIAATGLACGACKSCLLYQAHSHPDVITVAPDEAGKAIKIDQIREFNHEIFLSAQFSGKRIGIIEAAESMNNHAQNSLLKTLEEPPNQVLIVLLVEQLGALLATIRSRSQQVKLALPEPSQALAWLKPQLDQAEQAGLLLDMAGGAPLKAIQLASTDQMVIRQQRLQEFMAVVRQQRQPLELASEWQTAWHRDLLMWLSAWIAELIRLKSTSDYRFSAELHQTTELNQLLPRLSLPSLFRYLDQLNQLLHSKQVLNAQLVAEDLLIKAAALQAS